MRRGRVQLQALFLAAFFIAAMSLTVFGFIARRWMPDAASTHAGDIDTMITYLLCVTAVIFILGHVILAFFVVKYSGGDAEYKKVSRKAETLWALIPVIIMTLVSEVGVLALALPVWSQVYGETPADAVQVEIVGKQFEWYARYPGKDGKFGRVKPELIDDSNFFGLDEDDPAATDDILMRGEMFIPVDKPVSVRLRSLDVLHSFTVPEFRIKQDVIPGFTGHTQFTPTKVGRYEIVCAELCGLGHFRMRGFTEVKTQEEFDNWLAGQVGWFE